MSVLVLLSRARSGLANGALWVRRSDWARWASLDRALKVRVRAVANSSRAKQDARCRRKRSNILSKALGGALLGMVCILNPT